jgi:hypothetical protein
MKVMKPETGQLANQKPITTNVSTRGRSIDLEVLFAVIVF